VAIRVLQHQRAFACLRRARPAKPTALNQILKIVISALLIAAISEVSKRNSSFAALIASLPIVSLLAMIWMYHDGQGTEKIADFSASIIWYVLPSLILFVLLPVCLRTWQMSFYAALAVSSLATIAGFFLLKAIVANFGIKL
jgi:hypothetical protein